MATKKTTKTTKSTTAKKAPVKKAPVKKAPVKKKTTAKSAASKKRQLVTIAPSRQDFMTFRINRETVYWLTFGTVAIFYAIWIMQVQSDIQSLYDQIEVSSAESEVLEITSANAKKDKSN